MQKIREAQSRITARKLEMDQETGKAKALRKAHIHNIETREQLFSRRNDLVKDIPKEAITSANIPWTEKKALFAAWFAEHGHTAEFMKERSQSKEIERDPFDE